MKNNKKIWIFILLIIGILAIMTVNEIVAELNCGAGIIKMNETGSSHVGRATNVIILWRVIDFFALTILLLIAALVIVRFKNKKSEKKSKLILVIKLVVIAVIAMITHVIFGGLIRPAEKPVIYIYPEEDVVVNVKLGNEENIICSYPKYAKEGWTVLAKPNGDLIDLNTNRMLYSLYWEGLNIIQPRMDEGFVVKGCDSAKFLEEKLEILGLNYKEAEEFIIYWLPRLEANEYNFIRFQSREEIDKNMPLEITPKPDTIIRVMMEWKALDKYVEVPEQKLTKVERKGFTVVEWGGTEIL